MLTPGGLLRPFLSWSSMASVAAFAMPRGRCTAPVQSRCNPSDPWASVHQSGTRGYYATTMNASPANGPDPYRTVLHVRSHTPRIQHAHKLSFIGSCFTENIGQQFSANKWDTLINPFGILYNPVSMAACVSRIMSGQPYTESCLGYHQGLYYSFDHHSVFSRPEAADCLHGINQSLQEGHAALRSADWVFLTLGTAWAYRRAGRVVANCHKLPQKEFDKELLGVDTIREALQQTVADLKALSPEVQVVLTVSPVRHVKDGIVENSRSKAHLLAALHDVVDSNQGVSYFPAYEIMMDDLRDYRFYEADMLHPSTTAIQHIYHTFVHSYVDTQAVALTRELEALQRALAHRPFHPQGEAHQAFLQNQRRKLDGLQERFPYLDLHKERAAIDAVLITPSTER